MRIFLATGNPGKVKEFRRIFKKHRIRIVVAPASVQRGLHETGKTFDQNARIKACHIHQHTGGWVLADDSGIEIEALRGAPGIRSARYAGKGAGSRELCEKILRMVRRSKSKKRGARFVCALALSDPKGHVRIFQGICRGRITREMRGARGFGYDPIFMPCDYGKTFAELPAAIKNRVSHRGLAARKLAKYLAANRDKLMN